jgi:hypothetical protein
MDEMRAVYRNKLIQFTTESVKGKSNLKFLRFLL